MRLGQGEDEDMIQNNLRKVGVWINPHHENPNKNTEFSRPVNQDQGQYHDIDKGKELASHKTNMHRTGFD